MNFITKIRIFFDHIEQKRFQQYLLIFILSIVVLAGFIVFQNRRSVTFWLRRIHTINELREQTRELLDRAERVHQQRLEVDEMLAEDENFKISGYFQQVLTKLGLTDKKTESESTSQERDDNYRVDVLNAKFAGMTMKECVELLQEIEQNPRLYTNELEIKQSKKIPRTVDVTISIATLQPKAQAGRTE